MSLVDWKIADAKARFSDLVRQAEESPQVITKHGEKVSVMLSYQMYLTLREWEQSGQVKTRIGHFLEQSAAIRGDFDGIDLDLPRRDRRTVPELDPGA